MVAGWQLACTAAKGLNHFKWNRMLYDAGPAVSTLDSKHTALKRFLSYLEDFANWDHPGRRLRAQQRLHTPRDRESPRKPFALDEDQVTKKVCALSARSSAVPMALKLARCELLLIP